MKKKEIINVKHLLDTTVYSMLNIITTFPDSLNIITTFTDSPKVIGPRSNVNTHFSWDDVDTTPIPYVMKHILGEGVSSIVYEATHAIHGVCAVKVFRENSDYIEDELILLRKVQGHPNMIKVLDTWQKDDVWYIAMEKLDGTLFDVIGAMDTQAVYDVALQLTSSIMFLHHVGIVHFDLKPENIGYTVGPNGIIYKILDLGISEMLDIVNAAEFKACMKSGELKKVSLWYRPIESFLQPDTMDEKTDVWSIGCILYELLMGTPLFEYINDAQPVEYNLNVFEEGFERVGYLFLHTDVKVRQLAQVIQDCLVTHPEKRSSAGLVWWNLVLNMN